MTKFDWFENGHAQVAVDVGELSPSRFQAFIQYKRFLDVLPECKSKTEAINVLAEEFKASYSTIFRAIQTFE